MAKHIWLTVKCKNPKCGFTNLLKHYGLYEGQLEIGEMFTTGFSWSCGECGQTYRYEQEETKMQLFDVGPPPGWKSAFGPELNLPKSIDPKKIQ